MEKGIQPFAFQEETWQRMHEGHSGLVNAPTGCGKTFSVFFGAVINFINRHPEDYWKKSANGLQLLWVTPLRALAKDIGRAMEEVIREMGIGWKIGIRNGDTETKERERQKRQMPEVLLITPESLHLLIARKNYPEIFHSLRWIAVDEWHELLGSKRGVQVELAISRLVGMRFSETASGSVEGFNHDTKPVLTLSVWGISATIGNLDQAREVLLSPFIHYPGAAAQTNHTPGKSIPYAGTLVIADIRKKILIESIIPDEIEKYPWAGHLGN